jgi:choline dehydrogenase
VIALPHPRDEPIDVARLVEDYERAIEFANRIAIFGTRPADPGTPDACRRAAVENAYSLPHVVGTCRMGPTPANGDVVDENGQIHGVDGLFVADASVIPDAPSGFPHLITIMLAEHLVARWES